MRVGERTLLGFDFSQKRIGVAVGHELTGTVTPLVTLHAKNSKPDWEAITKLIEEWQPDLCVIGLPLTEAGGEQENSALARRFANQLNGRYHLPVELQDERFTSLEAKSMIKDAHYSKKNKQDKSNIDKIAAQLILQSWLEHQQEP